MNLSIPTFKHSNDFGLYFSVYPRASISCHHHVYSNRLTHFHDFPTKEDNNKTCIKPLHWMNSMAMNKKITHLHLWKMCDFQNPLYQFWLRCDYFVGMLMRVIVNCEVKLNKNYRVFDRYFVQFVFITVDLKTELFVYTITIRIRNVFVLHFHFPLSYFFKGIFMRFFEVLL